MRRLSLHPALLFLMLGACFAAGYTLHPSDSPQAAPAVDIAYLNSPEHAKFNLPFSEAVRVDDVIFTSTIGNLPGTLTLVEGGLEAETKQAMENVKRILEANGSSLDHVVKCTVMLTDMNEWKSFNAVYGSYFQKNYPSRASFGVTGLALGARVEIDCIAVATPR
jgi:2-iminobutanoate/2-iminopropanoate deaminase